MKEGFLTPSQLKERLSESFPECVPPHKDFQVGYFEGKVSAKCWIVSKEDIQAMYNAHFEGDVITIWCDGSGKTEDTNVSRKRKKDADDWWKHKKDAKSIYPHWNGCDCCHCICFCLKVTRSTVTIAAKVKTGFKYCNLSMHMCQLMQNPL